MTPLLIDGPSDAALTVVFAHGAGAGMEHEGMAVLTQAFVARGARACMQTQT